MATVFYWAMIDRHDEQFWVTIPDLLGVNVAHPDYDQALRLATEFAGDYVADLVSEGQPVPPARNERDVGRERTTKEWTRALIPVDVPGRAAKISITMDEALLKRVDQAAEANGESRSGFISAAVSERLRALHPRQVTDEDVLRVLSKADIKVDLGEIVRASLRK